MSGPIRLLVSDIDGTLVRNDKSLSDGVVAAAKRLTAAGGQMALISARPPSGMLWIAEKLGLTGPIAAFNGGTIVQADGTILSAERIAPEVATRALKLIDRPGVIVWLFHDGRWHAAAEDPTHMPREVKSANQQPVVHDDLAALVDKADKIVAVSDDHPMLEALEKEVAAALGDGATVARSQAYYLDITAPHANKGDGIARLAEAAGVPLDETAAIGDNFNDLPMLKRAALPLVMGNAPDPVKAIAAETVRSNDEDGVADAIDRILLSRIPKETSPT